MNQWSELAGNRRLKEQLSIQEEGRGLSHAYILCGPKGSGRHTLARLHWCVPPRRDSGPAESVPTAKKPRGGSIRISRQ